MNPTQEPDARRNKSKSDRAVQPRVRPITINAFARSVRSWTSDFDIRVGWWVGLSGRIHLTSVGPLAGVNPTRLDCPAFRSKRLMATGLIDGARCLSNARAT